MPGRFLTRRQSNRALFGLALIAALLAAAPGHSPAAEAKVSIDVPAGRWKTVRLKSLPSGARMSLEIITSGKIRIIIVDGTELKRFPKTRALFEATVEKKLGFSVVIPRTGDYYVILDNRTSADARRLTLAVKARPPEDSEDNSATHDNRDRI